MNKTYLIRQLLNHLFEGRDDIEFDVSIKMKDIDTDIYVVNLTTILGPNDGIYSRILKLDTPKNVKKFLISNLKIDSKKILVKGQIKEFYKTEYDKFI